MNVAFREIGEAVEVDYTCDPLHVRFGTLSDTELDPEEYPAQWVIMLDMGGAQIPFTAKEALELANALVTKVHVGQEAVELSADYCPDCVEEMLDKRAPSTSLAGNPGVTTPVMPLGCDD